MMRYINKFKSDFGGTIVSLEVFNPLWIMYHIGKPRAKVHSEVQIFVFCASVFALHKSLYSGTTIKYNITIKLLFVQL